MQRFLNFSFLLLIGVVFVSLPPPSIAKTVSHSGKCHVNKEMKVKHTTEVLLKSPSCQHTNHSHECSDCGVNCCHMSVIGFDRDMSQVTQAVTQKVIFSYLSPTVKDFHKGLFRPPIA